jgi:iron complex outermembrane receptor protein
MIKVKKTITIAIPNLLRVCAAMAIGLLLSPLAVADTLYYSIKKQPLAKALTQYAEQSNLQILFRPEAMPNLDVEALTGQYTLIEALEILLRGTQLQYTFGAKGVVVIQAIPKAPPEPATDIPHIIAQQQEPPAPQTQEELLVTGIQGSLRKNLQIKRESGSTLDAMNAEDAGKFPDKNIADSLQRIPGVSVDRIWGEGRDIYIRGTDKDINRTLMNGQNVASAYWWANDNPSRGFNYTILAAELISSFRVYKSPQADIDEGSIGGTVIIYTHKPFDMEGNDLRLTMEGQYSELPDAIDPQASLLGSWQNNEKTFGALVSINWQNTSMRRDGLEAFPDNNLYNIVDDKGQVTEDVYVIWGGGSAIFQQTRERDTSNLTLQWQPNENWQAVFNYVGSSMDMKISNQNYLFMPGGFKLREDPPVVVTDPRFGATGDGRKILLGGTMNNPDSAGAALDAIFRSAYVDSAVYDLDFEYHNDQVLLHAQLGTTNANGGTDQDKLYRFVGNTREQFSLSRNSIEVKYLDLNPQDPNSLPFFSSDSHDWIRNMEDSETYVQTDAEFILDNAFFSAIKAGFKWRNQTIENNRRVGSIDTEHPLWKSFSQTSLASVSTGLTPELHRQTATQNSLTRFAWVNEARANQIITPVLQQGLMRYRYDQEAFYRIDETINAAYIKSDFHYDNWQGNLGLRAVNTRQESSAYEEQQRHTSARDYNDYLPSFNLAYEYRPDVIVRSSLSRAMARPSFQNLSPNIVIDGTNGNASGGNPDLEPFRAKQGDLGIEWYFDSESLLSATSFYKTISTFIYSETQEEIVDGEQLNVTRPYNAEGAHISGLELQWQQHFGKGFGLLSNYTYTKATVTSQDKQQLLKLPGNSRDQINASLYYEDARYSLRLSYNYRSKSYGELLSGTQDETNSYQQWDFSANWTPVDYATLYIEGINLTNEVIYYRTANDIPQGLYENGRRFAMGVRLRF